MKGNLSKTFCQGRSFIGKAYFPHGDYARRVPKTIRNAKKIRRKQKYELFLLFSSSK